MRTLSVCLSALVWVAPLQAQASSNLRGTWRACFELLVPREDAPTEACAVVAIPSGTACGVPVIRFQAQLNSLVLPSSYNQTAVALVISGDSLSFGGTLVDDGSQLKNSMPANMPQNPPGTDSVVSRCTASDHDQSIFGHGRWNGRTIDGAWGLSGVEAPQLIGRFVMVRQ